MYKQEVKQKTSFYVHSRRTQSTALLLYFYQTRQRRSYSSIDGAGRVRGPKLSVDLAHALDSFHLLFPLFPSYRRVVANFRVFTQWNAVLMLSIQDK